jgi:hypothetical protein
MPPLVVEEPADQLANLAAVVPEDSAG